MKRNLLIPIVAFPGVMARAEPPWDVDDPGVTAFRTTTMYFSYRTKREPGTREEALGLFAFTYGLTPRLEIGAGLDALAASSPDIGRTRGWSDLGLSAKLLVSGVPDEPDLAVGYQATLPSGSRWASAEQTTHSFWLTGQRRAGRFRLTADAGVALATRDKSASVFYGTVMDIQVDSRSRVGLQLAGTGSAGRGEPHAFRAAVGATRQASERLAVQAHFGRGLSRGSQWQAYLGFTLDIPGGKAR
jgi:hypothetical protein